MQNNIPLMKTMPHFNRITKHSLNLRTVTAQPKKQLLSEMPHSQLSLYSDKH